MPLVLRLNKLSSLTFTELDGNFTYLDGLITTNTSNIATNTANISTNTTDITNLQGSRVTTSSYNAFTGSVLTTSSFNSFTSSVVTTSSFNTFTSSVITTSSFNDFTSSVVTTSSFNTFTSSVVTTSSFNIFTSSVVTTSSFNTFTSSVVTTSSFNTFTGSVIITGSNSSKQGITGSLSISGSSFSLLGLQTGSVPVPNVLMISSSGQVFITASSAIGGGTSNPSYLIYSGSVSASVNVGTGGVFTISSASVNLMTISSSGNVGIGTTTPTSSLEVYKGQLTITTTGNYTSSGIKFRAVPDNGTNHVFAVNSSDLQILSANQGSVLKPVMQFDNGVYGNGDAVLRHATNNSNNMWSINASSSISSYAGLLNIRQNGATYLVNYLPTNETSSGWVKPNGDAYFSGSVGIGTVSPTAKLEVSASANNAFVISGVGASATNLISITGSGGQILKLDTSTTATTMSLKMNGVGNTSTWDFITAGGTNVNGGSNNNYILSKQYADLNLNQYSALVVQQTGPPAENPIAFQVKDSSLKKYLQIDTGSTTISGSFNANNVLFVSGSNVSISGSFTVVSGSTEFQVLSTGVKMGNSGSDSHQMTGSFTMYGSGSTNTILRVQGSGSNVPIFLVEGSQGELFSVTDSLSGSLFSVNDISGLPILDVNSDQTTKIGSYLAPGMYASTRVTANIGVTVIYSVPTASYDSAYFDYNIRSGSVGRVGQIMAMWSESLVNYSEVSASSFGTTTSFVFGLQITGSNMILSGSAPTNGWTVKTIVKAI